ncbi:phosphopantetheine-binding protein [[Kitasatospora] papulosa]|uniref:phosphopantetheine-binding protein n=1 Tax=[Kitasatospora] papulosa TaxID=1464011 RepID=UPI003675AD9A
MDWDPRFEELLRAYLPFLTVEDELTPDTELRDAGLDSLATVELLGALEAAYDVKFLDEALNLETFATPASLWGALRSMTAASAG